MDGIISYLGILGLPILLGLLHGLSPCEHSWPILAPFAITAKTMKKLFYISLMFCAGTTTACVLLGIAFGTLGNFIPMNWSAYMGAATAVVLIILGIILIFKPTWLHFDHEHDEDDHEHGHKHGYEHKDSHENSHSHGSKHDHDNGHSHGKKHDHDHDHGHAHVHAKKTTPAPAVKGKRKFKHGIYWGMFSLSFVNMIIPCPTTVPMYTLALEAGSVLKSTMIFLSYAVATTIVLLIMTYFIGKASQFVKKFNQEKYEILLTRISGVLIAAFGFYMALVQFESFKFLKPDWIL